MHDIINKFTQNNKHLVKIKVPIQKNIYVKSVLKAKLDKIAFI